MSITSPGVAHGHDVAHHPYDDNGPNSTRPHRTHAIHQVVGMGGSNSVTDHTRYDIQPGVVGGGPTPLAAKVAVLPVSHAPQRGLNIGVDQESSVLLARVVATEQSPPAAVNAVVMPREHVLMLTALPPVTLQAHLA